MIWNIECLYDMVRNMVAVRLYTRIWNHTISIFSLAPLYGAFFYILCFPIIEYMLPMILRRLQS